MKRKISIVLLEEHDNINLYSIVINDNSDSEIIIFLKNLLSNQRNEDAKQIVNLTDKIVENGAQERYFRYEGKFNDQVCALPGHHLIRSDCRLYCLRYSDSLLIVGNGGIKVTRTYQEDPHLNDCVVTLQKINQEIQKRIRLHDIQIVDKTISGDLDFFI